MLSLKLLEKCISRFLEFPTNQRYNRFKIRKLCQCYHWMEFYVSWMEWKSLKSGRKIQIYPPAMTSKRDSKRLAGFCCSDESYNLLDSQLKLNLQNKVKTRSAGRRHFFKSFALKTFNLVAGRPTDSWHFWEILHLSVPRCFTHEV